MHENILRQRVESFATELARELEVVDQVGLFHDLAKEMNAFALEASSKQEDDELFASILEDDILG